MAKYGEAGIRPLPFAHCQPERARGRLPARHIGRRSPGPSLKDDHVVRTFIADEPRDSPPRAVDEFLDLGRGCEKVVEPGVHQVAISDAYTERTRHAVSPTVPLQIGEMCRILSRLRVVAGSHDPVRERAEAPEQSATVPPAAEEPKLFPYITTVPKCPSDSSTSSRRLTNVSDTAPSRDVNGTYRRVDRDDVAPACMKLQRHATRSASNVEHATVDRPERTALHAVPSSNRRQIIHRGNPEEAVVALHDLVPGPRIEGIEQHPPERILHPCTVFP
jgi:hypothetical protein